jgi:hypothetical protein
MSPLANVMLKVPLSSPVVRSATVITVRNGIPRSVEGRITRENRTGEETIQ